MKDNLSQAYEPTKEVGMLLVPVAEIDPKEYNLGVIVARFQVSNPTKAHRALLDYVTERHSKQLIILGVPLVTGKPSNPLDYGTRELMIKTYYPNAQVLPVMDTPDDDEAWSKEIDKAIFIAFGKEKALLYGSRDSFIKYYKGKNKTQQLDTNRADISGTESRAFDSRTTQNNPAWRAGVINTVTNTRPVSYPTADIAGFSPEGLMLIGQKEKDGNKWRFIGGFKEVKNTSIEEVASREFLEETGEVTVIIDPQYILSMNIDDPRYRGTGDTIFTFLLAGMIANAEVLETGSDDVANIAWLNINTLIAAGHEIHEALEEVFISEHVPLMYNFITKLGTYKTTWLDSIKDKIPTIADFIGKFQSGSSNPWMEVINQADKLFKSSTVISIDERKQVLNIVVKKTETISNYLANEELEEETNQSKEK